MCVCVLDAAVGLHPVAWSWPGSRYMASHVDAVFCLACRGGEGGGFVHDHRGIGITDPMFGRACRITSRISIVIIEHFGMVSSVLCPRIYAYILKSAVKHGKISNLHRVCIVEAWQISNLHR